MSEIKPALSAEEWASGGSRVRLVHTAGPGNCLEMVSNGYGEYPNVYAVVEEQRHAVAAKCLHGQPFGFTHADVALVRELERWFYRREIEENKITEYKHLHSIANRLEILLPPEGS